MKTRMTMLAAAGTMAAWAVLAGGCIAWEIRDEMRVTNANLGEVQSKLAEVDQSLSKLDTTNQSIANTNKNLDDTIARLEKANALIQSVGEGLGRLDTTNQSLDTLERQLALLESIRGSLSRLDTHLASLRKTIGRIDSAIPFLDLGGGETVTDAPAMEPAAETAVAASGAEGTPTAAAAGAAESAPAPVRRDPLSGIWATQFPTEGTTVVMLPDNTYRLALKEAPAPGVPRTGGVRVEKGTWAREDKVYTLTAEPTTRPAGAGGAAGAGGQAQTVPGRTWKMVVVSSSTRAAAVEIDGNLTLLVRP